MTRAVLIWPPLRTESIVPWGARYLADFVARHNPEVELATWDLTEEPAITGLWRRAARVADELGERLSARLTGRPTPRLGDRRPLWFSVGEETANLGAVLLAARRATLEELVGTGRARRVDEIVELQAELRARLRAGIVARAGERPDLIGVSTLFHVLWPTLAISRASRAAFPDAALIAGGEWFTECYAEELVHRSDEVDGVVIGLGEVPLSSLLTQLAAGRPVAEMQIERLINRRRAPTDCGPRSTYRVADEVDVAQIGDDFAAVWPRQEQGTAILHVLPRRGCATGTCVFCNKSFSLKAFGGPVIDVEWTRFEAQLVRELRGILDDPNSPAQLSVRLDGDEVDVITAARLAELVDEQVAPTNKRAGMFTWASARYFRPSHLREVVPTLLARRSLAMMWNVAIESLNPATLRIMKKGASPLRNLVALKAAQDMGVKTATHYFLSIAGEDQDGLAAEVDFLERAEHLLSVPRNYLKPSAYFLSDRDGIFRDQEHHGIEIELIEDRLLAAETGATLPVSTLAVAHRLPAPRTGVDRARQANWRLLEAIGWIMQPKAKRPPLLHRVGWLGRTLHQGMALALYSRLFAPGYLRRFRYAVRLGARARLRPQDASAVALFIEGDRLVKRRRGRERVTQLSALDLALLRGAYWPVSRSQLIRSLSQRFERDAVEAALAQQLERGTLVSHGTSVACLAHDPAHLATLADSGNAPA